MGHIANPQELLLTAAAAAIRKRELSAVDYARSLFARMDQVESRVQAWVTVDRETVLAEAKHCDEEAAQGRFRGPLHGVPIGVKDIYYTNGMRTSMGAESFRDFVPDCDADVVTKLKQAGAIILGKTVTTVFVFLDPGPTRNPWNIAHTPGGSSSGSAAAVAARMCAGSIGSQTVGSVGRPAAYNGVVSLMPTQARVSMKNVFPLSWPLDHAGIFARSVDDVALQFQAIAQEPVAMPVAKLPIRIGVVRDFFEQNLSAEAKSMQDNFVSKLANDTRFRVAEARLPQAFDLYTPVIRTILRADVAAVHQDLFHPESNSYGPILRQLIETGKLVSAADYLRARRLRRLYQRELAKLFESYDVLLTPAAPGPAPEGMPTGNAVMNGPWTLADFPTMTLPYGLSSNGLPLGVQLSAPAMADGALLGMAKEIESVAAFNAQPNL